MRDFGTVLEAYTIPGNEALYRNETHEGEPVVRCLSCGNRCLIREGRAGVCRVRMNRGGKLRAPGNYVSAMQVDPIEKKPFFHVLPGQQALSFGMLGCNFHCDFCQNWVSSQVLRDKKAVAYPRPCEAQDLVDAALEAHAPLVVSTYNEPLITSDWAAQIFDAAHEAGLLCGYVSNGFASEEVLEFLAPRLDVLKVDLKAFEENHYQHLGGRLTDVLRTIEKAPSMGCWLEVVTLLIPGFNDSTSQLQETTRFLASVSRDIPWHVTAYRPQYRHTDGEPTTRQDLERAYDIGKEAGLHYVYAGNLSGRVGDREHTTCPGCSRVLVKREGFRVIENHLVSGHCPDCQHEIAGVWEAPTAKA